MIDDLRAAENKPFYIAVWRHVLSGWLRWPDERVDRWILLYDEELEGRGNILFYHEEALWHVTRFLIPERLCQRLGGYETMRLSWRLQQAIGIGNDVERTPAFDWDAARQRVEAVLHEYGETLAGPDDHIGDLRQRLGADCP